MVDNHEVETNNPTIQENYPSLLEEIWRIILLKLDDPLDYIASSNVCQSWNSILEPLRTQWLQKVIFPHLYDFLSPSEFLKCRLVSREWKQQIDKILASHEIHLARSDYGPKSDLRTQAFTIPILKKELDVMYFDKDTYKEFMQSMGAHGGNPFVGRSIGITFKPNDVKHSRIQFFERFGKHLWHVDVFSTGLPLEFVTNLEQILFHVPNLRKLNIYGDPLCIPGGFYEITDVNLESGEPYNIPEFMEHIKSHPFPKLPFLETLEISLISHPVACEITCWVISSSAGTLRRLHLGYDHNFPYTTFPGFPMRYPCLTELKVTVSTNQQLGNLARLEAPLRRLCLFANDIKNLDVNLVSGVLMKFRTTLRALNLNFIEEWCPDHEFSIANKSLQQFIPEVNLPQLKTLELINCLTFCGEMPPGFKKTLEYLHIHWQTVVDVSYRNKFCQIDRVFGNGQGVDQIMERGDLKDSSIWKECPKLRKLTVEQEDVVWETCTREMYEYLQKQKKLAE